MDAVSYESITVGAAAIGFTAALLATQPLPQEAYFSVEDAGTAGIRYRMDGTDPTAAEGHPLFDGDTFVVSGQPDLKRFRAIRTGGANVTIRVTYSA